MDITKIFGMMVNSKIIGLMYHNKIKCVRGADITDFPAISLVVGAKIKTDTVKEQIAGMFLSNFIRRVEGCNLVIRQMPEWNESKEHIELCARIAFIPYGYTIYEPSCEKKECANMYMID